MLNDKKKNKKRKHITIETPCKVKDMEKFLNIISHCGHWHDSTITTLSGKIVISYEED